jgi:hypothetical protein
MKTTPLNNFGKTYLTEECQKIRIDKIIRNSKKELLQTIIQAQIETEGWKIEITTHTLHHGGKRLWFKCPLCALPCGIIYKHPLNHLMGCRRCLKLDYRARRYKGMIESN